MIASPYAPGSAPPVLAGRRVEVELAESDLAVVSTFGRFAGRIRVSTGPRGVGKTSLLRVVRDQAAQTGFVVGWATARPDESLVTALSMRLRSGLDGIGVDADDRPRLRQRLRALTLELGAGPAKAGVELDISARPEPGGSTSAAFADFLAEAAHAARERGSAGLCLFIDEIQAAPVADLRTVAYAWQELQGSSEEPPAVLFAAGLPNAPDVLTDAVTFSERFAYRTLSRLDDQAATEALRVPAEALAVGWDERALALVVRRAEGYPYFVQLYGDAVWRSSSPEPGATITGSDVHRAQAAVDDELQTLFRARWFKASPGERKLMAAMAQAGEEVVRRSRVAELVGVTSNALSVPRRSLIDKGLIEAVDRGHLRFTVPGFAGFVLAEAGSS